jgi:FMN-dependent NADH-azoreductase
MMNNLLLVLSSARGAESISERIARRLVGDIVAGAPGTKVVTRDLVRNPLPHLEAAFASGRVRPAQELSRDEALVIARSDVLVDEALAADTIVIAAPMHNFSVPSSLKAWIDHIARPGRTFTYTATGPEGLLKGKRVILVLARGGIYTKGPMQQMEFQESYLRAVLGFLGITDIETIHVEGIALGEDVAHAAIERATQKAAILARGAKAAAPLAA